MQYAVMLTSRDQRKSVKKNAELSIRRMSYFAMRGGSRKKIAKNRIPRVPARRKVYTSASILVAEKV
jgi:hypothetical protein